MLGRYFQFARATGLTLKQALGLEDVRAGDESLRVNSSEVGNTADDSMTTTLLSYMVGGAAPAPFLADFESAVSTANAQGGAQNNITNTALNALHNQRIVRAP